MRRLFAFLTTISVIYSGNGVEGGTCTNYHSECRNWAERGRCNESPTDYMMQYCAGACNPACNGGTMVGGRSVAKTVVEPLPPVSNGNNCVDLQGEACKIWASRSECGIYPILRESVCRKSCHPDCQVKPKPAAPPPRTTLAETQPTYVRPAKPLTYPTRTAPETPPTRTVLESYPVRTVLETTPVRTAPAPERTYPVRTAPAPERTYPVRNGQRITPVAFVAETGRLIDPSAQAAGQIVPSAYPTGHIQPVGVGTGQIQPSAQPAGFVPTVQEPRMGPAPPVQTYPTYVKPKPRVGPAPIQTSPTYVQPETRMGPAPPIQTYPTYVQPETRRGPAPTVQTYPTYVQPETRMGPAPPRQTPTYVQPETRMGPAPPRQTYPTYVQPGPQVPRLVPSPPIQTQPTYVQPAPTQVEPATEKPQVVPPKPPTGVAPQTGIEGMLPPTATGGLPKGVSGGQGTPEVLVLTYIQPPRQKPKPVAPPAIASPDGNQVEATMHVQNRITYSGPSGVLRRIMSHRAGQVDPGQQTQRQQQSQRPPAPQQRPRLQCKDRNQNCPNYRAQGMCNKAPVNWWRCPQSCHPGCTAQRQPAGQQQQQRRTPRRPQTTWQGRQTGGAGGRQPTPRLSLTLYGRGGRRS